ncbi:MAG: prephenate dehydrogenase [Micromonosporaceae bacterium]
MLTVSVLGLGLIGGSLLRALGAAGVPAVGYDAAPSTRTEAAAAGCEIADSVADAADRAELVVLAMPLPAVPSVLDELAAAGYRGILTDVTSVKSPVYALVASHLPGARYVGGHPMAGKETSGFATSDPGLFTGCAWALCLEPGPATEPAPGPARLADWLTVAELLTRLGVRVVPATPVEHDTAVARISHLPHLTATALAAATGGGLAATLGAGSYRDATRVAASRPGLVAAMCGGNAAALAPVLDDLIERLQEARRRLDAAEPTPALTEWLLPGHTARASWPPTGGEPRRLHVTAESLVALGRSGGWLTDVSPDRRAVAAVHPAEATPGTTA